MSIQLLASAVKWAKANPNLHAQVKVDRCLMSKVAEASDLDPWDEEGMQEILGITEGEFDVVFWEYDNAKAIEKAEEIVAKYSKDLVSV